MKIAGSLFSSAVVHLAEEFGHVRLFHEMLRTCGLDKMEWMSLSPVKEKILLVR
ncbi:hypothetical protein [Methylobacter luteus]|uniref:hypothetical protein n=1 Tax=Methylobacter luteus TaxID=415 RepID=UPI00040FDC13|nr:hypothetical protein [Methylobacter luteus]